MSEVRVFGRPTRTAELQLSADKQSVYATFFLAINRKVAGKERTDFPRVVVFGKQAESFCKYVQKGDLIAVDGIIQTGSYEDDTGRTIYTTDLKADRIHFLDLKAWREKKPEDVPDSIEAESDETTGLVAVPQDEEVPF